MDVNLIQRTEETFASLEKIKSCYQFAVTNVGIVHSRKRSCWCLKCFAEMIEGSLNWSPDHQCSGCISSDNQTTNIYNFQNRPCAKLSGPDVNLQLSQRRLTRNEMASQLTPGSWVVFKSTDNADQLICLSRTLSNSEWGNSCIKKNDKSGTKNIDGAKVT